MKNRLECSIGVWLCVLGATVLRAATWNGGGADNNWSTADNWGGTLPAAGEALVFNGTSRCTNVNDWAADTSIGGITFASTAGQFSLSGNRINLGGSVMNNTSATQRVNFDMVLDSVRTLNAASGNFYLNGTLSGSGGITMVGVNNSANSIVVLGGTNTYTGATTVSSGTLRVQSAGALGTADQGTTVANSARLELAGNVTVTGEVVTIVGNGGNNDGALQVQAGSNTWAGKIILGSDLSRIGVMPPDGMLVVSGMIDDGANKYSLVIRNDNSGGPTVLSGTNTYKGETQLIVGTLRLFGGDNRLPTNTVLRFGNNSTQGSAMFDLNGQNQAVAGLTLVDGCNIPISITNSSATASTLTVNTFGTTAYTYAAPLNGSISLTKLGTNTLTLAGGVNLYNGVTTVAEGRLVMGGPWVMQESTLNTGNGPGPMGTLVYGTNLVVNFGGLTGTNDLAMTNASGTAISLRIRGSQTTSYDGHIVSGCDLTKTGTGYFTMKNVASYTGKTSIVNGKLIVPSEDALGVAPAAFVQNQIAFDGGTLRAFSGSNFVLGATTRGVTLTSNGGTVEIPDATNVFTVAKPIVGSGGLTKRGNGLLVFACSNAYDGLTVIAETSARMADKNALGSAVGGTAVWTAGQLGLANGLVVSNESISIGGAGLTMGTAPAAMPQMNRGALQAETNATAEWAGPVFLTAAANGECRVGAQDGGHLIISGVISDGGSNFTFRTSSNPYDRSRGTVLKGANTYSGSTGITRGTLFAGATNTLSAASVVDIHWSNANNTEYAALDLNGFDQTVGGLQNSGNSGAFAVVTNSASAQVVFTINQSATTSYGGLIAGLIALVKSGSGTLTLTNRIACSGTTTVVGGTLRLGMNGAIPATNSVVLSGGTLDVSGTTNTLASLTVSADSMLVLGTAGSLTVANQNASSWSGLLTLTGSIDTGNLRFLPALNASQLGNIRYYGKHVMQNSSGYIVPWRGTVLSVL